MVRDKKQQEHPRRGGMICKKLLQATWSSVTDFLCVC